ncbi:hypothetical protein HHI36_008930 [Cryptolaemus montrouzieri]|uniref:DDE-1 domain-containing protein n=1 Tax=Cryptolaemus montrouzieri TaxID=559131 RepID=A0ABD2MU01_9CUCU
MLNAAPGAWGVCSDSVWMTAKVFLEWFKKFIEYSVVTVERPVLLLSDGHSTHTRNIDSINEARSHGVFYDNGCEWVQKCGIWPYNSSVFSESDFATSLMTDIPQIEREPIIEVRTATTTSNIGSAAAAAPLFNSHILAPTVTEAQPIIFTEPNCLELIPHLTQPLLQQYHPRILIALVGLKTPGTPQISTFSPTSPQQIMPFPATRKASRVVRKRGKTAIIISSPYKYELEETLKKDAGRGKKAKDKSNKRSNENRKKWPTKKSDQEEKSI